MIKLNTHGLNLHNYEEKVYCGINMKFDNGNSISIQFGWGNYSSNRNEVSKDHALSAEIAIFDKDGNWHNFGNDTVKGYCTADEVAKWIFFAANFEIDKSNPFE